MTQKPVRGGVGGGSHGADDEGGSGGGRSWSGHRIPEDNYGWQKAEADRHYLKELDEQLYEGNRPGPPRIGGGKSSNNEVSVYQLMQEVGNGKGGRLAPGNIEDFLNREGGPGYDRQKNGPITFNHKVPSELADQIRTHFGPRTVPAGTLDSLLKEIPQDKLDQVKAMWGEDRWNNASEVKKVENLKSLQDMYGKKLEEYRFRR